MPSHSGSDASVEPSCYNPLSLPSHVMCIVRFHTIGCSTATFDDFVFVVVHCCVSVVDLAVVVDQCCFCCGCVACYHFVVVVVVCIVLFLLLLLLLLQVLWLQ